MSEVSERLKPKSAKQQAIEAAVASRNQRAQDALRESEQMQQALTEQLERLLPGINCRIEILSGDGLEALLTATGRSDDSFIVTAVIDGATTDELRMTLGPRLIGKCPKCEHAVPSEQIGSLSQLGELLTAGFVPDNLHNRNCAALLSEARVQELYAEQTLVERLKGLLLEVIGH